jgi:hypothetical protein
MSDVFFDNIPEKYQEDIKKQQIYLEMKGVNPFICLDQWLREKPMKIQI